MKFITKQTGENVSLYNRSTHGLEIIDVVKSHEEFYQKVQSLEDSDFFPQDNGVVLRASQNEAYDPQYPNEFDFGDYRYYLKEVDYLLEDEDAVFIRALKSSGIINSNELLEELLS